MLVYVDKSGIVEVSAMHEKVSLSELNNYNNFIDDFNTKEGYKNEYRKPEIRRRFRGVRRRRLLGCADTV